MKKNLLYISISVLSIIIITIIILNLMPKNNINDPIINNENIIFMGDYNEILTTKNNYVITDYNEYKKIFNNEILNENSFDNNNYVLILINYNPCSEEDLNITDYTISNNIININVSYRAKCGLCAPQYKYYLLKVNKDITNITLNISYNKTNNPQCDSNVTYKPIIYLYPTKEMNINIKLGYPNKLITTYPKYNNEWNVIAMPNGDIIYSNRLYYGLYWEGENNINEDFKDGFLVNKKDLITFLEEKLKILGLNEKESNEFIIYWLPILEQNEYNLIRFESLNVINEQMPLEVNPKPETLIRILMVFKPIDNKIDIKEQKLTKQTRKGYTVIEWGGSLIN